MATMWTTDKDGIIPALLAAEITARMGRDPGEIYNEFTREFGANRFTDRVEAPASPAEKELLGKLFTATGEAHRAYPGEKSRRCSPAAPGNGASIGGLKVACGKRLVCGAPFGPGGISTRFIVKASGGADHLQQILSEAQAIVTDTLSGSSGKGTNTKP